MRSIRALYDNLGFAPASFDITHFDVHFIADILREIFVLFLNTATSNSGVRTTPGNLGRFISITMTRNRSSGLQGRHGIKYNWQRLVIDINGSRAIFCCRLCFGQYDCDRVTTPADLF